MSKHSALIVAAFLTGCGGSKQPVTYPVSGTVHFTDGKPMKSAMVKFRTTDHAPPVGTSGKTDDQGHFQFGAAEGESLAVIVPTFPRDTDDLSPDERDRVMNPIDEVFLDYERTPLKCKVTTDSAKNQFDFKIWRPRR